MNLSEMTMTDDARSVIRAFSDAPVMTLQAVTTMTGLSEHTTRFILEQLRQTGWVLDRHERWSLAEGDNIPVFNDAESGALYTPVRRGNER
ncbi:hypothetical protein [Enterobacter asburiae]|uniref:hypothetical protein n=1 Tax=Enterobacter asburiae TaxID=61645 RepID=UPI0021CE7EDA|nr:hypothetical protein [Enterobacter asburiae]MCU6243962.1 hypothetical protein [Enterobacter asburiae]